MVCALYLITAVRKISAYCLSQYYVMLSNYLPYYIANNFHLATDKSNVMLCDIGARATQGIYINRNYGLSV